MEKFIRSPVIIKDERDVVKVLYEYFLSQGFFAVKELQLTNKVLNIKEITKNACLSVVRIDLCVADQNFENIFFIEAENGLWVKHPTQYIGFANYVYLACPEIKEFTFDSQLEYAKQVGVGVIIVGLKERGKGVRIRELLQARRFKVSASVKTVIVKMIEKRLLYEKKANDRFLREKEEK